MRPHQMDTNRSENPAPVRNGGSDGYAEWSSGPAARPATTAPMTTPAPRLPHQGTGRTARAAMSSAAPRATSVSLSRPGTQSAVTVEPATVYAINKTSTVDQSTALGTAARVRSQAKPGPAASNRRGLSDSYRISGPHEACEVIALPDDV